MAKAVIMPRFGMTQEDAMIVRWICGEGDRVEQGDPICEVTTDKVNMEVEAPTTGILSKIVHAQGETVPVTQIIAYIRGVNEAPEAAPVGAAPAPDAAAAPEMAAPSMAAPDLLPVQATPLAQRMAAAEGLALNNLQGSGAGGKITREDVLRALSGRGEPAALSEPAATGKVTASPAARRIAQAQNIPLALVPGSGPQGRVQGWDVATYQDRLASEKQAAVKVQAELPPAELPPAVSPLTAAAASGALQTPPAGVEVIPLEGMRKTIADRLQASYQQAPHIFMDMEIDMGRAIALREALNPRQPAGRQPISLTALIARACALALREQPLMNSHFVDGKILRYEPINIGMAVALEAGLIVPVIHDADRLGLNELGDAVADLSRRAREGRLRPDDVSGGTFTISNLGMFGVDHFTAILNPPQVGILAVGRVARRFVPDANDQPVARSLMNVSLSADHRVIDGLVGARFLAALRDRLENPNLLVS